MGINYETATVQITMTAPEFEVVQEALSSFKEYLNDVASRPATPRVDRDKLRDKARTIDGLTVTFTQGGATP